MRTLCLVAALAAAALVSGCNRRDNRDRANAAARQTGKAAYQLDRDSRKAAAEVSREGKRAAQQIAHGLNNAARNVQQGWNEAKHQDDTRRK